LADVVRKIGTNIFAGRASGMSFFSDRIQGTGPYSSHACREGAFLQYPSRGSNRFVGRGMHSVRHSFVQDKNLFFGFSVAINGNRFYQRGSVTVTHTHLLFRRHHARFTSKVKPLAFTDSKNTNNQRQYRMRTRSYGQKKKKYIT
jgi:hypothetical protein